MAKREVLPWQSRYDGTPTAHGWYPVLVLWDGGGGRLPEAAQWRDVWEHPWLPISHFIGRRFGTKDAAKAYAIAHDPSRN